MARTAGAGAGSSVWRRAETAAYVESADRAVLLDLDRLELPPYVLEGSASEIWACVDGVRSQAQIVRHLAEAYGVSDAVVAPDVAAFVEQLGGLGLLVRVDAADLH